MAEFDKSHFSENGKKKETCKDLYSFPASFSESVEAFFGGSHKWSPADNIAFLEVDSNKITVETMQNASSTSRKSEILIPDQIKSEINAGGKVSRKRIKHKIHSFSQNLRNPKIPPSFVIGRNSTPSASHPNMTTISNSAAAGLSHHVTAHADPIQLSSSVSQASLNSQASFNSKASFNSQACLNSQANLNSQASFNSQASLNSYSDTSLTPSNQSDFTAETYLTRPQPHSNLITSTAGRHSASHQETQYTPAVPHPQHTTHPTEYLASFPDNICSNTILPPVVKVTAENLPLVALPQFTTQVESVLLPPLPVPGAPPAGSFLVCYPCTPVLQNTLPAINVLNIQANSYPGQMVDPSLYIGTYPANFNP